MLGRSDKLSLAAVLISGISIGINLFSHQQKQQEEMIGDITPLIAQAALVADKDNSGYTSKDEWEVVYRRCGVQFDPLHFCPPRDFLSSQRRSYLVDYVMDGIIERTFPPGYPDNRKFSASSPSNH